MMVENTYLNFSLSIGLVSEIQGVKVCIYVENVMPLTHDNENPGLKWNLGLTHNVKQQQFDVNPILIQDFHCRVSRA